MSVTSANPLAVVCIPSFRRPKGLQKALQSLANQRVNFPFAVVVVDNDAVGKEAVETAKAFFEQAVLDGHVVVEVQQGNVHAINRAFATAASLYPDAAYVLMMDDDEEASDVWLSSMVLAAEHYAADIVGGPVRRRFEEAPSGAIAKHPLFSSIECSSGLIEQIHGSGNCLIRASVFGRLASPLFDVRFNFLGGGDMDFFTRCRKAGLKFAWSNEALIFEDVPAARMKPKWIMERSLRTGIINYSIDRANRPGAKGAVLLAVKNLISLGLSIPRALALFAKTKSLLPATHPVLMSVGRVMASLGVTLTPYQAGEITGASKTD